MFIKKKEETYLTNHHGVSVFVNCNKKPWLNLNRV